MSNIYSEYEKVCKKAMLDDMAFATFKNQFAYSRIVEHKGYELYGRLFLKKIQSYSQWEKLPWENFQENDIIGKPEVYKYDELSTVLEHNVMSPTTLRYIMIGIDVIKHIKKVSKNKDIRIVEIGGGYGGQCKILFDLAKYFNINIIKYTLYDLLNVSKLQKKYLEELDVSSHECISNLSDDIKYDFLISNYSLAEFDKKIQNEYIEKVVKNSKHGYIIWNVKDIHPHFKDFTIQDENPKTGIYNKVITY